MVCGGWGVGPGAGGVACRVACLTALPLPVCRDLRPPLPTCPLLATSALDRASTPGLCLICPNGSRLHITAHHPFGRASAAAVRPQRWALPAACFPAPPSASSAPRQLPSLFRSVAAALIPPAAAIPPAGALARLRGSRRAAAHALARLPQPCFAPAQPPSPCCSPLCAAVACHTHIYTHIGHKELLGQEGAMNGIVSKTGRLRSGGGGLEGSKGHMCVPGVHEWLCLVREAHAAGTRRGNEKNRGGEESKLMGYRSYPGVCQSGEVKNK